MVLVERAVQTQEEAQAALAQLQQGEVDGFLVPRSLALNIPGFLVEAAAQRAMPVMCDGAFWVERGASPVTVQTFTTRAGRRRGWWTRSSKGRRRQRSRWR